MAWTALAAFAAMPVPARAEPYVATTANQAVAIAPWWAWWVGLALFAFVAYPAAVHFLLRAFGASARAWHLVALGIVHFLTGAATLALMLGVSIMYSRTSPLAFVGAWLALTALLTIVFVAARGRAVPVTRG